MPRRISRSYFRNGTNSAHEDARAARCDGRISVAPFGSRFGEPVLCRLVGRGRVDDAVAVLASGVAEAVSDQVNDALLHDVRSQLMVIASRRPIEMDLWPCGYHLRGLKSIPARSKTEITTPTIPTAIRRIAETTAAARFI